MWYDSIKVNASETSCSIPSIVTALVVSDFFVSIGDFVVLGETERVCAGTLGKIKIKDKVMLKNAENFFTIETLLNDNLRKYSQKMITSV